MQKLGLIQQGANAVSLNMRSRTEFETAAREVFRKYKALFPEPEVRPYIKKHNAIEAIYAHLNKRAKSADVTEVILELQHAVDESIFINENEVTEPDVEIDLSKLDFEKLRNAFAKAPAKNKVLMDLHEAVEKRLERMMRRNPLRSDFYKKYQEIIENYNKGKDLEDTLKAFEDLVEFVDGLSEEESRAAREDLTEEYLAIFDLLRAGKELSQKEQKGVKKIAVDLLKELKREKLKVEKWRESQQVQAAVRKMIRDKLLYLPIDHYSEEEVQQRSQEVFQHVFQSYPGGGRSVYRDVAA